MTRTLSDVDPVLIIVTCIVYRPDLYIRVTSRWNKMDKSGIFARRPIYEQFRWNNYFNCASISADNNLVTGMMEKAICNGRFSPSIRDIV